MAVYKINTDKKIRKKFVWKSSEMEILWYQELRQNALHALISCEYKFQSWQRWPEPI